VTPPIVHTVAFQRFFSNRDEPCDTVYPAVYDPADAKRCARHLFCQPPNDCALEPGRCP
jgi:hypothetical protein